MANVCKTAKFSVKLFDLHLFAAIVVLSGNDISSVGFQDVLLLYKDIIIITGAHTKRLYSRRLNYHRNIYEGDR